MKILGIDPGSRNLGFCVLNLSDGKNSLVEAGVIKIKSTNLQEQISEIVEGIDIIFNNNDIDEVAMEDIFYAHNPQSVLKLAQARGAIALKLIQVHGNFYEYTALQVKKAITGNGKATKEQVAFMVKRLLGIKREIKPLDITDAMGVAITHSQRAKLRSR